MSSRAAMSFSKGLPTHPGVHAEVQGTEENHDNDGNNDRYHWGPFALIPGEPGVRNGVITATVPLFIVYD
jgi:hypothetical protein